MDFPQQWSDKRLLTFEIGSHPFLKGVASFDTSPNVERIMRKTLGMHIQTGDYRTGQLLSRM